MIYKQMATFHSFVELPKGMSSQNMNPETCSLLPPATPNIEWIPVKIARPCPWGVRSIGSVHHRQ